MALADSDTTVDCAALKMFLCSLKIDQEPRDRHGKPVRDHPSTERSYLDIIDARCPRRLSLLELAFCSGRPNPNTNTMRSAEENLEGL